MSTKTEHTVLGVKGVMQEKSERANGLFSSQKWTVRRVKGKRSIRVTMRFDDQCGNGHMDFSITGETFEDGRWESCGCIHEEIAKVFPELAPLIKWHLTSSDGPMHYIANTVYHADAHGPTHAWVYYKGPRASDPLEFGDDSVKERLLGYFKAHEAQRAEGAPGYRVQWNEKTIKTANLEHARSCAVWPEATDAQLTAGKEALTAMLEARAPALHNEFKIAMINDCGFEWREAKK